MRCVCSRLAGNGMVSVSDVGMRDTTHQGQ
jgi:hypothetical protein